MFDFHERRKLKSILYSWPMSLGLSVIALLLLMSVVNLYRVERDVAGKRAEKVAELEQLKLHAAALESEVGYLESTRGIESEIRDRFEVAKEGEKVIVIVDEEVDRTPSPTPVRTDDSRSFFDWLIFW